MSLFGILSVEDIITKSSNIGAAKIGIKLGAQSLYDYAWNYGFGQRTGIPLPGEARGILYSREQILEQSFHRPNSDGPRGGGDALANA